MQKILASTFVSGAAAHAAHAARMCPGYPKSQAACPIKNITDELGEFEPVCVKHYPQIGGQLAEYQTRRCMKGDSAPYYQDAQGVFRCACCGAPLWMPHSQFDQQPAENWGWPSFHSKPIIEADGFSNVCHRGPANASNPSTSETPDLGLGVAGEVACAKCGIHLGDYFNDDEDGKDHYCINGACMIPPGQPDGSTCKPSLEGFSV